LIQLDPIDGLLKTGFGPFFYWVSREILQKSGLALRGFAANLIRISVEEVDLTWLNILAGCS
jgi:hypothetical protein